MLLVSKEVNFLSILKNEIPEVFVKADIQIFYFEPNRDIDLRFSLSMRSLQVYMSFNNLQFFLLLVSNEIFLMLKIEIHEVFAKTNIRIFYSETDRDIDIKFGVCMKYTRHVYEIKYIIKKITIRSATRKQRGRFFLSILKNQIHGYTIFLFRDGWRYRSEIWYEYINTVSLSEKKNKNIF